MTMTDAPDKLAPAIRRLKVKARATPEDGEGTFQALVSSYNETYEIGWYWSERILANCFAASIEAHNSVFPVCWMHAWELGPIGDSKVAELDLGLLATGQLYLDLDPLVARLYRAMKAGAVDEWSIAFYPEEIVWTDSEPEVDQIVTGDLIEVTSCFRGANSGTQTIDLRSAGPVDLVGGREAASREVIRLRSISGRADFGHTEPPKEREAPSTEAAPADVMVRVAGTILRARGLLKRADDEPTAAELAQSLDAVIDEIAAALDDDNVQGAADLAVAADSTADDLLEALGVADDDDLEPGGDENDGDDGDEMDADALAALLSSRAGRALVASSLAPSSP